jgi:hypothetical protein
MHHIHRLTLSLAVEKERRGRMAASKTNLLHNLTWPNNEVKKLLGGVSELS